MSEDNKAVMDRLKKIERHLTGVDQEISQLTSLQLEFENTKVVPSDRIWNCTKCGNRLGIYDVARDELRVRYRDFFAYWKAGQGGYLKLICRSCSHINELLYEEKPNI